MFQSGGQYTSQQALISGIGMKKITTTADLAINGAPPALSEPLHVGRPNIGSRQAFLGRVEQILDNQRLTNNGPTVQEFAGDVAGTKQTHREAKERCDKTNIDEQAGLQWLKRQIEASTNGNAHN